jgi:hypothetical protein
MSKIQHKRDDPIRCEVFKGKSPLKRPVVLYLEWTMDYPVDFLCYTPEEFEEKRKEISIVRQAIKEGIII